MGARSLREAGAAVVVVVAAPVDEGRDREVPGAALRGADRHGVGVVAALVKEAPERRVGGRGLRVARALVAVVPGPQVAESAPAVVVAAALREVARLVDVVPREVEEERDPARSGAPKAARAPLGEAVEDARLAVARLLPPEADVVVVARGVEEGPMPPGPAKPWEKVPLS